jgi:heme A synthase
MSTEKQNYKMKNTLILVLLVTIAILVLGGMFMLEQAAPMRADSMGMGRDFNPLRFESVQTGPTGRMVMSTGIVLLLLGLGVLVLLLWVGWKKKHNNPS